MKQFSREWDIMVAEEENKNEELLKDEIKDVQQKKEIIEKNVELSEKNNNYC